jgi:hypothetical protein
MAKDPISAEIYRNLCLSVNNILGPHLRTRMKMCVQLYGYVNYTMYHFHSGSRVGWLFTVLRPAQEYFTYMETLPLPVKGCKI